VKVGRDQVQTVRWMARKFPLESLELLDCARSSVVSYVVMQHNARSQ
jgi:hypothetical protein